MKLDREILFKENQRFRQLWFWIPLLAFDVFLIYKASLQFFRNEPFGNHPLSNIGLLFLLCFMLLFNLSFYFLRLETAFTKEGIYVRFFPFHLKFKFIDWNIISQAYIREYKPLLEFGGWGIRYGFAGKAYNVSGNMGLQLAYDKNSKLLIGTQKAEEMEAVLNKLGFLKE
ncbi:hypothetical protein EGI22_01675 [Lacihabitans sp. LS3-19]|uniref:DUF6141 family protein n=1 Tax=Lacihabitans sp. LS3-19 TaxID=2487335 RepID=UPI0020CF409E|nr:DUF6141 family protein [Lacihabitans sp. LS3-19]MCP9766598.1 hypothetical protein [Lacihabitans sp. LS3-19]